MPKMMSVIGHNQLSLVMRKPAFCTCETKTQMSFAVTAKLISVFVFATRIVQSLYFLNPRFQASNHLLWLYRPVCVGPGPKPRRLVFSQRGYIGHWHTISCNPTLTTLGWVCGKLLDSYNSWVPQTLFRAVSWKYKFNF